MEPGSKFLVSGHAWKARGFIDSVFLQLRYNWLIEVIRGRSEMN